MSFPSEKKEVALLAVGVGLGIGLAALAKKAFPYKPPKVWQNKKMGGKWGSLNKPTAGKQFDKTLPRGKHSLQLYSLGTPNGVKVTALLEFLNEQYGIEYDAWLIDIGEGDQFGSDYVKANPNSKIPVMLHYVDDQKEPVRVFESANIMVYLCEHFDTKHLYLPSLSTNPLLRNECLNWLFWVQGSAPYLGGGFGHFFNYAPHKDEYAINRFSMEAKRQLDVLDRHLGGLDGNRSPSPFLCGDDVTIADMCAWPWYGNLVLGRLYSGSSTFLNVQQYTHVCAWANRMLTFESVQRGRKVNRTWGKPSEKLKDRHSAKDFDALPRDD